MGGALSRVPLVEGSNLLFFTFSDTETRLETRPVGSWSGYIRIGETDNPPVQLDTVPLLGIQERCNLKTFT